MNISAIPNLNILWSKLIVEELSRLGVTCFCLAPGSRSGPLAVAVADQEGVRKIVHFDERGLAFFALGVASATRSPTALICTSGTAAANFFPAVIEAAKKKVPLIVITADRPVELQKTGAHQTIDQAGLFGHYSRFTFQLPAPDLALSPAFVLTSVDQAVSRSRGELPGPVHLNCAFREPLDPREDRGDWPRYCRPIRNWLKSTRPYTTYIKPERGLARETMTDLVQVLNSGKKGLIAAGKLSGQGEARTVFQLAERLGWPVFPDVTSGLRLRDYPAPVVQHFDLLCDTPAVRRDLARDLRGAVVLHVGGRMTARNWDGLIEDLDPREYISVIPHPLRSDPMHRVTVRVESTVRVFVKAVLPGCSAKQPAPFLKRLLRADDLARKGLKKHVQPAGPLTEPGAARTFCAAIPDGWAMFLANSNPLRLVDSFAAGRTRDIPVGANRGASGIDGTVASAAGFAVGLNRPTAVLIGDLALLHDLNSLALWQQCPVPLVAVVINNGGGGIFSQLPISNYPEYLDRYFTAGHEWVFDPTAEMFGLCYARPVTLEDLDRELRAAFRRGRHSLIEVVVPKGQVAEIRQAVVLDIQTTITRKGRS